ncbi:MAG: peptidylprolyl isomerase [Candidatus Methanoplasma sp.]|nr:peptidylprolyl isomerase [Candidatus Methanoplasma sp.]
MAETDVKKIVRMDYSAYFADNEKLYDTTSEEVAKEAGIYNESYTYGPMAYIVGSGELFPALEEAISKASVGEEAEVVIPSEDAAGARDPSMIETHPIREFHKRDMNPYPGMQVSLGSRTGSVLSVGAGRVKVDFNSPLAGHDLLYRFTIREVVEDKTEKAKAVMAARFGDGEGFSFDFPEGKVSVTLPDAVKFNPEWHTVKLKAVRSLREAFGVDTVEFVEVWSVSRKEEPKQDEAEGEPAAE